MATDTSNSDHLNYKEAPAITVVTEEGRIPLSEYLDTSGVGSDPTPFADSTAADAAELVVDFNALLAVLRDRGILAEGV